MSMCSLHVWHKEVAKQTQNMCITSGGGGAYYTQLLGAKIEFRHQDLQIFDLHISNFHPLEVVCRGSDTQLQVGEKNKLFNLGLQWSTV